MVPAFLQNAWQNLRHEGAIADRFLPLRIYILFAKIGLAVVGAGFTLTALWGHYSGLVEGNPWIGRLCAGFPEAVMVVLCFIPIFCGYDRTGRIASNWYYALLVAAVVHAGMIYAVAYQEKLIDKKVAKRQAEREGVAESRRKDEFARNADKTSNDQTRLKDQAADIRARAEERAKENERRGNSKGASWIRNEAEQRITKLYADANQGNGGSDAWTPLPSTDEEIKALRNEIKGEMSAGWFGNLMMSFKQGADIYLESIFAIVLPFLLGALGAGHTFHTLWEEGRHEEAAAGRIRTPAAKGAYEQQGTGQLPTWKPQTPDVGRATRRFTADQPPGGVSRR